MLAATIMEKSMSTLATGLRVPAVVTFAVMCAVIQCLMRRLDFVPLVRLAAQFTHNVTTTVPGCQPTARRSQYMEAKAASKNPIEKTEPGGVLG